MANLRYSAASSSRIGKKPLVNPLKKHQQNLKKILPVQAKYLQNLKSKKVAPSPAPKEAKNDEKLPVLDYDVLLDFQLSKSHDIMVAVDTILQNQWAESTLLHSRFHSNELVRNNTPEQLLFLLPGLSMESKAEIMKYRAAHLPLGLVTVNQLYSIYEKQGNTFVDRNLELRVRLGQLRKFVITNAAPVVLNSPQKFQRGKVTYGYENVEVVVHTVNYANLIEKQIQLLEKELAGPNAEKTKISTQISGLRKFAAYVKDHPTDLFITNKGVLTKQELSCLVSQGFVTLTSNHLNEIEAHQYSISYPDCGMFLKLINAGRSWLVKLLSKSKHREMLETAIFDKWEGTTPQGNAKMTNFRKPFYGYDLNWILADALGAGTIEVFNTPVGRGWQLTGKL